MTHEAVFLALASWCAGPGCDRPSCRTGPPRLADGRDQLASASELALKLNGKPPKEFLLDRELHISRLWRSPETWKLAYQVSQ